MMVKVRDFRELRVWVRAMDLAEVVYGVVKGFPKSEVYGLVSQLRRASSSVYANVAEGCGKRTSKDFVKFLHNAMGSVREVQSHLIFCGRVRYLERGRVGELVGDYDELLKMLARFVEYVLSEDVE